MTTNAQYESMRLEIACLTREIERLRTELAAARAERDALLACRYGDQQCHICPDAKCCDNTNEAARAAGGGDE